METMVPLASGPVNSSLHSISQGICVCYGFAMRGLSGKALSAMHVEGGVSNQHVMELCSGNVATNFAL